MLRWLPLLVVIARADDPQPPRSTMPGCVPDIVADAAGRWGYALAEYRALTTFRVRPVSELGSDAVGDDLDADAEPDWVVRGACLPSGDCEETLYLSSWGCTRFALRYTGQLRARKPGEGFVGELETREAPSCDGKAVTITDWVWIDDRFRESGGVTCPCPGKSPALDAARSARCPAP